MYPTNYCIYDFESTGFDVRTVDVTEIGAKRVVDGKEEVKSWLVQPPTFSDDYKIPAKASEVTGITEEMLKNEGIPHAQAFKEFIEFAGDLPLVGHNIGRYDNPILRRFIKEGECKGIEEFIDTAAIYKARFIMCETKRPNNETLQEFFCRVLYSPMKGKYNLSFACDALKIDVSDLDAHRAAADVEMTDRLYKKLCMGA